MPFSRFFGRKESSAPPPPAAEATESDESEELPESRQSELPDDPESLEVGKEETDDLDWRSRARAVIPTGASTGSKRAEALYGDADAIGPTHFSQAVGCTVIDADGNQYIDCTMALGAVALGYAETNVTRAVVDTVATGNVSALSSVRE